ncbi:hypothetical protein BT93_F1391 [Corymbia citriodora subsp. variegata]|nr:hypothetical protein BT93_F1391 [Corymbia citriodora subsp. variegata]
MAAGSSSSSCPSRHPEIWNYLWIPLLISFSKELALAKAQSGILLPGQLNTFPSWPAADPKLNFWPVIEILSHPRDGTFGRLNNASNASYIAALYVKFVESVGAREIYNEPWEALFEKLFLRDYSQSITSRHLPTARRYQRSIATTYRRPPPLAHHQPIAKAQHGQWSALTGGWAKTGLYHETVKAIFKKVLAKNDAGDHFPLYAICLGFELLTMIISEEFNAADQASTLQFIRNANIEGTVFHRFSPDLLKKLSTDCLVIQNHHYGISPERLMQNTNLTNFFEVLTTSTDGDNKSKHSYPVTAFQWHPEKNAFEWGLSTIPHSDDAIGVTQHVANFFVSEARKSVNRASAQKVLDNLIYNYSPTYCGKAG